ncbi:MAG: nucleotide exchange factor GrpE, partial [Candidatus Methanomethylophilus sp.]|nr:nucleotide exchange factor GrpE [Methanomethylophilus sp.]
LMKILENQGVTEVPVDKGFDPNMHEALMVMEGDEDGKVAQVYQKGYLMNGRVLRTAKVVVTKKKEQEAAPVQDEKTAD